MALRKFTLLLFYIFTIIAMNSSCSQVQEEPSANQVLKEQNENKATSKTIQLFTDIDDPASRIAPNNSDFEDQFCLRKREATLNPLLFLDQIKEINIGDVITGYLFEDQYFEGVVTGNKIMFRDSFTFNLKMVGNNHSQEEIMLSSRKNTYHLNYFNASGSRQFEIRSSFVREIDVETIIAIPK